MRRLASVVLTFAAGFLVSFNVVRNLYTVQQHSDRAVRDGVRDEPLISHHSYRGAVVHLTDDTDAAAATTNRPLPRQAAHTDAQERIGTPPLPTASASSSTSHTGQDPSEYSCHAEAHAEYWGDLVKWGSQHLQPSKDACCEACRSFKPDKADGDPCNTWVWCPEAGGCAGQPYQSCWLKYQPHPEAPAVARGPQVAWTSGSLFAEPNRTPLAPGQSRKFHVAVTSNDSRYVQWQMRVMYYWYQKRKAEQGPDGDMGGFTRVLHSGRPDHLMNEIPTHVVDRLSNEHGFVVLSRPNAFVQWLKEKLDDIEEDYILMSEPDHLYLAPIPNLMNGDKPAAFPFFYISPKDHVELLKKYVGADTSTRDILHMDPIGSSPVMLHKNDLAKVAPVWHDMAVRMKTDPQADRAWGWVLEMWAYTCAAWVSGVHHDLVPRLQAQPPWDTTLENFYILHYTYGNDYTKKGVFTPGKMGEWRFDKRSYMGRIPPTPLELPPKGTPDSVRTLIEMINEASQNLPYWDTLGVPP